MECTSNISVRGRVSILLLDKDMKLKRRWVQDNLITNFGRQFFGNKILDIPGTGSVDKIGIGNGDEPAALDQTGLLASDGQFGVGEEHETSYQTIRYKQVVEPNSFLVEAVFPAGVYANKGVVEIGLFTDEVDGYSIPTEMIARTVLDSGNQFTKADEDYLSIMWNIIFGR